MKLFLIDGHAIIFKMYYAFLGRPMVNTKGQDTSILFGFVKFLFELVEREKPTHLAVSFDPPGGTFRGTLYPEYKANRGQTPQLVIDALEPLSSICRAMGIPVLMVPGFEADDVVGSMAKRCAREGFDVYMVTPDKDYGQLVEDHIFQYRPGKAGGESEVLGPGQICAKWNISCPERVIDILTLCGDSSDNVPGVDGVGPVGAAKLLARYGTVDGIYAHLEELPAKQKEKFDAASSHIALSRELVTIRTDVDLSSVGTEEMALKGFHSPQINSLLDFYELPSLKRMLARLPDSAPVPAAVQEQEAAPAVMAFVPAELPFDELESEIASDGACSLSVSLPKVFLATARGYALVPLSDARRILENPGIVKYGFGLKSQIHLLEREGITLSGRLMDSELMHYIINPERSHSLQAMLQSYLGVPSAEETPGGGGLLFDEDADPRKDRRIGEETQGLRLLGDLLYAEMRDILADRLYDTVEEPLIRVLARMETVGVKIDISSLKDFSDGLRARMADAEAKVREMAGDPTLNVASPKQIGEALFERMKIDPRARKPSKGNWPTDEETLLEYSDGNPIIGHILEYRSTRKLLSAYIEPLPGYVSADTGRVHTTFNQALTATGRLSSSNPNLQNIPVRTEEGRQLRKAFVPGSPGRVIMSADYSQIELRVMAHLSCDRNLIDAFRSGQDIHAATAAKIYGKPIGEVSKEERRSAKTANFGIMYGISAFGLAQRLGCSRSEAKELIDGYFESFPAIKSFISDTLTRARENGYVETISGRRRYIHDLNSRNANLRAFAERNAVNAPIQGSAADIMKLAMIAVDKALSDGGYESRVVLQIHDELVLEVPEAEIAAVSRLLVENMEGVVRLNVPLTVECSYGKDWLEAH